MNVFQYNPTSMFNNISCGMENFCRDHEALLYFLFSFVVRLFLSENLPSFLGYPRVALIGKLKPLKKGTFTRNPSFGKHHKDIHGYAVSYTPQFLFLVSNAVLGQTRFLVSSN